MSSIKKTSSIIIIAIVVAGVALGAIDQINSDDSDILEQIEFNAVYSVSYTHLTLPTSDLV